MSYLRNHKYNKLYIYPWKHFLAWEMKIVFFLLCILLLATNHIIKHFIKLMQKGKPGKVKKQKFD